MISTDLHMFHGSVYHQPVMVCLGQTNGDHHRQFVKSIRFAPTEGHTHIRTLNHSFKKQWKIKQISILRMLKQQFRTGPRLFSRCLGGFVFNQGWWSWIVNFHQICLVISRYSATLIGYLFCRWFRFGDFDFFICRNIFVKPTMCFVEHLVILSSAQSPVPTSSRHWNPL